MRGLTLLVVGALIAGASTSIGFAMAGGNDVFHACANNVNGQLRLVGGSDDCRRSEQAIHWSQGGSPAAISFYTREASGSVEPRPDFAPVPGSAAEELQCEAGDVATGSGFDVDRPAADASVLLVVDAPIHVSGGSPTGWLFTINNWNVAPAEPAPYTVYVVCAAMS
jgi:hypothetical protein